MKIQRNRYLQGQAFQNRSRKYKLPTMIIDLAPKIKSMSSSSIWKIPDAAVLEAVVSSIAALAGSAEVSRLFAILRKPGENISNTNELS